MTENLPVTPKKQKVKKPLVGRLMGSPVLIISILIHVLLAILATFLIVQRLSEKRKPVFQGQPTPVNLVHAEQHEKEMAKKKNAMQTPEVTERIVTTGLSPITLPEIPDVPNPNAMGSSQMAGTDAGLGGGVAGNGSGGGGMAVDTSLLTVPDFGSEDSGLGMKGIFYDFKQTAERSPIKMTVSQYDKTMGEYVKGGWQENFLGKFFKVQKPLYLPQCLIPVIDAEEGPQSFGVGGTVKATFTGVHYQGVVSPPTSGRYRFIGYGDNILVVRFNHQDVLESSLDTVTDIPSTAKFSPDFLVDKSELRAYKKHQGLYAGQWFEASEGGSYPMEILIGESGGGKSCYYLLIEKEGDTYEKDKSGFPLLPVFRLANVAGKPDPGGLPPHQEGGPIWHLISSDADAGN